MAVVRGCDSANEPTTTQAIAAASLGVRFWGAYVRGPGATHDWSLSGFHALHAAGIAPLPIYVPALDAVGHIASQTPEADADAFVAAMLAMGITGAGVLDTEASMRDDPWTATYERRFAAELSKLGQQPVTYEGGFSLAHPGWARWRWWIITGYTPPPGTAFQGGTGNIAGVEVDWDFAAPGFPFAHFIVPVHPEEAEMPMFARDPKTGVCALIRADGSAQDLGANWPAVQAAYGSAKVPMVVVERAGIFDGPQGFRLS